MIICPAQGFVFVHIPKCAGSAVRSQIVRVDPHHRAMGDVGEHPVLGRIDYGHVPLGVLREHFPDDYAAVRDLVSFAIMREPLERFGSALRQTLWRYHHRPMTAIPAAELREMTLPLLDEIAAEIDAPSHRMVFFSRQESFVFDRGERLVDHVLPMALVPDFIGYVGRRAGVELDTGARANQNVDLRVKGLGGPAYALNDALRRVLPRGLHTRIKDTAVRLLSTGRSAAETSGVLDMAEVRDFVAEHYAGDAKLYDGAMARRDALAGALAEDRLEPAPRAA